MKIILFDDDGEVLTIFDNVGEIKKKNLVEVEWDNGQLRGINANYAIVDDSYAVEVGDQIDPNEFIESLKEQRMEEVNINVNKSVTSGFVSQTTGDRFETAPHDQTNFSRRLVTLLKKPNVSAVNWKTADGKVKQFTRDQFMGITDELDNFITGQVNKGWQIKENLKTAQTVAELRQISLEVNA